MGRVLYSIPIKLEYQIFTSFIKFSKRIQTRNPFFSLHSIYIE